MKQSGAWLTARALENIGVKLAHPDKQVCAIVGDGGFMMTALEILTATMNQLGAVFFVFDDEALAIAGTGRPVIVGVNIDYSRKSVYTQGVVKVNLGRFPLGQKARFIGRALKRHTIG